jgi:hypothetical protein
MKAYGGVDEREEKGRGWEKYGTWSIKFCNLRQMLLS